MNLGTLLLDTSPPEQESAYDRLLRLRKWILLTSLIGTLIDLNLFRAEAAGAAIRIAVLPEWLVQNITCWALGYLLLHYTLLGWQSISTYDMTFQNRRHAQVHGRQMIILSRLHAIDDALASLDNDRRSLSAPEKAKRRQHLSHERSVFEKEFTILEDRDPYQRGGFLLVEFLMDVLKTAPVPIVGNIVFFRLVW